MYAKRDQCVELLLLPEAVVNLSNHLFWLPHVCISTLLCGYVFFLYAIDLLYRCLGNEDFQLFPLLIPPRLTLGTLASLPRGTQWASLS